MSVCFEVIVRTRINQRCVCVSSGILVHFAPVIQALVFFLLSVAPHPVLGFLTGRSALRAESTNPS